MLKKFIIFFAIFIILLLIISRCGSDVSTDQDALSNVAGNTIDNVGLTSGDVAGLTKDSASNTLGVSENTVNNIGSAIGEVTGSAKTKVGDALDSAENSVNNGGSTIGDAASSAGKAVDNVGAAIENVADSAKDAMDSPLDSSTDTGNAQSGEMADSNLDLNSVNFKFNSSELESHFYTTLDSAVNKINKMNNPIEVAGHADNIGSHGFNMALSLRRAATVLGYLVSKGVDANRLSAKGYGAESPGADNSTSLGRDANRRVELYKK